MQALRDQRLAWLVRNAARHIPFYRDLLGRHGIEPGSVNGIADIERLPIVSRAALQEAAGRAWAVNLDPHRRIVATTSGSTGRPLSLAYSRTDRLVNIAIGLDSMAVYGWRPWHRGMALGSHALPVDHLLERAGLCRWSRVSTTLPVPDWLEAFHRIRPHALHSYPSALREFCFEARSRGGLGWLPRVLTVGGESYPEELTPLVRDVFGQRPLAMYGAVEGGRIAFECPADDGLHVRQDAVHLELLEDGRAVDPGATGEVHLTSLINTAVPIFRYRLGDRAEWVDGKCGCGLWWPRIRIREGRSTDVVRLAGGRSVPVATLGIITGESGAIRQFQFLRRSAEKIVLRYEPAGNGGPPTKLRTKLERMLPGIGVELEATGKLPRTRTGKVALYIDDVKQ